MPSPSRRRADEPSSPPRLYRHNDRCAWRAIDDVIRINRLEAVRLAAVAGLADRFGLPRPPPPDDGARRRERARDALLNYSFRAGLARGSARYRDPASAP